MLFQTLSSPVHRVPVKKFASFASILGVGDFVIFSSLEEFGIVQTQDLDEDRFTIASFALLDALDKAAKSFHVEVPNKGLRDNNLSSHRRHIKMQRYVIAPKLFIYLFELQTGSWQRYEKSNLELQTTVVLVTMQDVFVFYVAEQQRYCHQFFLQSQPPMHQSQ